MGSGIVTTRSVIRVHKNQLSLEESSGVYTDLYCGDCLEIMKKIPTSTVNLIVTSPPYADQRNNTYGGIRPDEYIQWFLPRTKEFLRVLKDDGTFILNIKEKVDKGERHTYVLELIQRMREQGWLWTEEFVWVKKNSHPGKWPNRFRDGWERLLQFNKSKSFAMYQDAVKIPVGDWSKTRLKNLSDTDKRRDNSKVQSGFGKNISNWVGRELVYPNNVLTLPTESSNKNHSAVFPKALPGWFIKLFTESGDTVLDPFLGSGTTSIAAMELGRNSIGIEIMKEYCEIARDRIKKRSWSIKVSKLDSALLHQYIEDSVVAPFYQKRTEKLEELKLESILRRKNPYLFKAKNIQTAGDFAKDLLSAHLSSQEETIFGDLLEGLAIHINTAVFGGWKAEERIYKSVDLIFDKNNTRYAVGIKSGPNWGNSDQINTMKRNFKQARTLIRRDGWSGRVICVNGCIYGKEPRPHKVDRRDPKKTYFKYCGQEFWHLISDDNDLYQTIITPLDKEVKKRDDAFKELCTKITNQLTKDLLENFSRDSQLNWKEILDYVSKKT